MRFPMTASILLMALLFAATAYGEVLLQENFEGLAGKLLPASQEQIPADLLGWTHTPPPGWRIDNSRMAMDNGVDEWRGWSFTTMDFWRRADGQGREKFTLGEGVFAVAESDEYDDAGNPPPFDSTLISPAIHVPAGKTAYVQWDTIHWSAKESACSLTAAIDGGEDLAVADYTGRDVSNLETAAEVAAPDTGRDWTLVLKWRYAAKNGWFWGIDNIAVTDTPPIPAPALADLAGAEDWPAYLHDQQRSGVSVCEIALPLAQAWVHRPPHPPCPSWPEPAREDVLHAIAKLSPTSTYDRAFHTVAAGDRLYYGSSATDSVYCLNAETGDDVWRFPAGGPVRLAPVIVGRYLYFGADDGCVYCLKNRTGNLVWRQRVAPDDARLPGNGRMISRWPVRSSVVAAEGLVYAAAGLFPNEGVYLCAMAHDTGEILWRKPLQAATQGYMAASESRLFLPTGRTAPVVMRRRDGKTMGSPEGLGGAYTIVMDDMLVHGPSEKGQLHVDTPDGLESIVAANARAIVAKDGMAFMLHEEAISALDRAAYVDLSRRIRAIECIDKKERTPGQEAELENLIKQRASSEQWRTPCLNHRTLIKTGSVLFTGGDNQVCAWDAATGKARWSSAVQGDVYGLAVARGRLFASTEDGSIYCFAPPAQDQKAHTRPPHNAALETTPEAGAWAARILQETAVQKGYCLALGAASWNLACALAKASALQVLVVEPDEEKATGLRRILCARNIPGAKISVQQIPLVSLAYPDFVANLVVAVGIPPAPPAEVARVLCPRDGRAFVIHPDAPALNAWADDKLPAWSVDCAAPLAWGVARRGLLKGEGEWTHTYADPGNTACSGDVYAGAPVRLQWFGQPGPRQMVDRHFRNVPPLYKGGRVFIPGDEVLYAADAYNGTLLWTVETPGSRRVGVFLDSSNMAVDAQSLFLVSGSACLAFDVETGAPQSPFTLPDAIPQDGMMAWGYLARQDGRLYGSARPATATYHVITREAELNDFAVWYPNMRMAISAYVFSIGPDRHAWTYGQGRIIDSTLTLGDGRIYFIETHSPKALADTTGRLTMLEATEEGQQFLVALNADTGTVEYKHPIDMSKLQQPTYLQYTNGILLLSGARIHHGSAVRASGAEALLQLHGGEMIKYSFYAFDARTGALRWTQEHDTDLEVRGGHGEYNRHPTLVGATAYTWPYAYHIETGAQIPGWKFDRRGHGCGGVSGAAHALFWRGNNPWMYDLRPNGGPHRLTNVTRPGCWINIIAAGGLILIPEASAGCTCGYSIQASLAFAPVSRSEM